MRQTCKYNLIQFLHFIIAVMVLNIASDFDSRHKSNSLKDEVRIGNSSGPANRKSALEKVNNTQDKSPKVSYTSEYYQTIHYNFTEFKLKTGTIQRANQTPSITLNSRLIRTTQFDEL